MAHKAATHATQSHHVAGHGAGKNAPPKKDFRSHTRQRIQSAGAPIPVVLSSAGTPLIFPRVGLLSKLFVQLTGFLTASGVGTATLDPRGPWNLIKRITGTVNLGVNNVFDTSGWGMHLINRITDTDVVTETVNAGVTTPDPFYQATTTLSATTANNPVSFILEVPIAVNDGPQFDIGLVNLQSPEIQVQLNLTFGAISDAYSTVSTITGVSAMNVNVWYQYYEIPSPDEHELPKRILHRLLEDLIPIAGTGDTFYQIPRQGILLQMLHWFVLNGAMSVNATDILSRRMAFNLTDTPYNVAYIVDRILNRFRYGHLEIPAGAYIWDLYNADQAPTQGDLRDAIDTEALASLYDYVTISGGATLGSNNNFMNNLRRITQNY